MTERQHEIGVRMALGARRGEVFGLVTRYALELAGAGVMLGAVASAVLARVMAAQLYQISPTDPLTYGSAAIVLLIVALGAAALPARQAMRVDPLTALRVE